MQNVKEFEYGWKESEKQRRESSSTSAKCLNRHFSVKKRLIFLFRQYCNTINVIYINKCLFRWTEEPFRAYWLFRQEQKTFLFVWQFLYEWMIFTSARGKDSFSCQPFLQSWKFREASAPIKMFVWFIIIILLQFLLVQCV